MISFSYSASAAKSAAFSDATCEHYHERPEAGGGEEDNGQTSLILSCNSFVHLKSGAASLTIAPAPPTASIGQGG